MARDRCRRSARGNRLGLVIVGMVLLAVGAAALAAGQGLFGPGIARTPLLSDGVNAVLAQPWVPYVTVAVAFVAGFLALRWLMVQGMNDTVGRLYLERHDEGNVEMSESAARGALEQEVAEYPGVRRARARLTESGDAPHLRLALTLDEDADVTRVWHRVREEGLANLRSALELEHVPAVIRMSMTAPAKNPRRSLA
ncbi:alkaline shock response membrane anchor protein AmaP [Nocardiopsis sp. MG754419]|uniref:alkaline shock response membrane anchor protein AmaP n=1 Tax=Nocardiopsis sp. MG754419 TaxID=2259865 RepID=UPI001BAC3DC4|nr:alkaline shock response membrane anchor protein AmaP [Nocardiopsis sp. MG754419]MBR8741136.1 alkaline shock response membrane anchor protein AmaP [Nocardiopsis sp. MG754419]